MRNSVAVLLLAAAMSAPPSFAADNSAASVTDMQALRAAVRADKKAYVASLLALTPDEEKKFWPAYEAYQRTMDITGREKNVTIMGVIGQDKPVSDPYAKQIAKDIMVADDMEAKARHTLYSRVMRALPAVKAVRYLQLENKIRAVQAYDMAESLPLIK